MKKALLFVIITFFILSATAQKQFFSSEKMVETGVYYYPEAWNPNQWDRDFKKMANMGFEFTHMAEFAWALLEPREGEYDFKWLDKAVELSAKYGLKVIMCTPSATPPVWLTRKYPEVLVVMANGQSGQHGTREHYSWSSAKYRELTEKIVAAMAQHYGNDKRIWGWQIDNEPSHYGTTDYGVGVTQNFRTWLQQKYKTIDNLNQAWGTAFWSGIYSDFNQIENPNPSRLFSGPASITSILDFKRFSADECAAFISLQNKTLRKSISKSQFVTSNFMHQSGEADPWKNNDLDFISYTMYPVAGYSTGLGSQGFRMGDPWRISWANDIFRPLKGVTGVMELQPGQVNWGSYNPQPYPGVVRAWLWNSFAGGLDFICSYRFRQPLYGSEQFHYGMVGTDGVTELTGGLQYRQFMAEIRELRKLYKPNTIIPKDFVARKTALVYSMDNQWETDLQKQTFQWNQMNFVTNCYSAVKSMTAPVDIISEDVDLTNYPVVIAPAYQMTDKTLINKWMHYVQNGGNLILTCRTGLKDRNGHFPETVWGDAISELIGAKIEMFDNLGANNFAKVKLDEKSYDWNIWGDILVPNAGTEVWATYADQFYAGKAAATHRRLGKGTVTYIGTNTKTGIFEKEIIKKSYIAAGILVNEQPDGVMINWRNGFWIAINYSSENVTINIPKEAKICFGTRELTPAGVAVWQ